MSRSRTHRRTRRLLAALLTAVSVAAVPAMIGPSQALAHPPNFITKLSPGSGSTVYTTSPTVTWQRQNHSDSYHVIVKCEWGWYCNSGDYYVDTSTSDTSYRADYLPPYGWYSWRVSGENADGEGPKGAWWSFCVYCY